MSLGAHLHISSRLLNYTHCRERTVFCYSGTILEKSGVPIKN